jgi:tRNA threonylcarbamoyl adenosine modification protein YeaZ
VLLLAIDTATDAVVVGVVRLSAAAASDGPAGLDPASDGPAADPPAGPASDGPAGPADSDPAAGPLAAALAVAEVLAERTRPGVRQHGEQLMPAVLEACAEAGVRPAELDAVVCGLGPGPFTGLRVGIASAAAVADAVGVPAHGVCSLDAIAAGTTGSLLVVTDARRREVYWAAYRDGRRTDGPAVDAPAELAVRVPGLGSTEVAGTLAETHAGLLGLPVHPARVPTPAGLVAAAAGALADGGAELPPLEPLYLRRPDAVPPATRKRVTA